ncbi:hypothetical protein BGX33_003747 [Mortierella sp. NVP41]|nr:hypothetical protein BGX33_003747 [Mortierella sp. NVP41]
MGLLHRLQQRTQASSSLRPESPGTTMPSRSNSQRSMAAMDRAMSIPELVERILSFLPQQSLRHVASLVCKDWLRLCRPLFAFNFQWTDSPQFTLVPLPPSSLEPPVGRSNNGSSSRRWRLRRSTSTPPTAHTLIRVIPEKAWLLKKLVGLTTLKCRLNYKSPVSALTLSPPNAEGSTITTATATTATTVRMVSTQIAILQDHARADLIEGIRILSGQGKLSLLQLELVELDDFAGFLQPILSTTTTLTCLWLKKIAIQQLPIGQVLIQCPHIEELVIECEVYSSRTRLTMVLLDDVEPGQEERQGHGLPKDLRLKRLHLRDVLIKESTVIAILDSAPGLYDLKVQAPVIPPPTPPITPSATAPTQHEFTTLDVPLTVSVGVEPNTTTSARGVDLRGEWLTCDRLGFFQELGVLFPQLTSLHFTRTHHRYTDTMIRAILRSFPNATRWSLVWRDLPDGILRDLNQCVEASSIHQIDSTSWAPIQGPVGLHANHLTSLEILPMADWTPRWGNALHEFLCASPLLEHLRAGSISYYIENLDLNGLLPGRDEILAEPESDHNNVEYGDQLSVNSHSTFGRHYYDPPPSSKKVLKVWACRNLKTLHLEFSRERPRPSLNGSRPILSYTTATSISHHSSSTRSASSSSTSTMVPLPDNSPRFSRIVYGYISRFCPNLQDLLIRAYRLNMTLQGGFVLLTRLQKLKRVAISQYDCHFSERDMLPWIMKRRQLLSGIQALQWKAVVAGWWRVLHSKELGSSPLPASQGKAAMTTAESKGKHKEGSYEQQHQQQRSHAMIRRPKAAPTEKLGQLSDVVDVLTEIMADRSSVSRDTHVEGLAGLVEDCRASVWPELECVRIVHGQKARSGIKEGAIRAVLKKHRPEVEFQWVSWINQF